MRLFNVVSPFVTGFYQPCGVGDVEKMEASFARGQEEAVVGHGDEVTDTAVTDAQSVTLSPTCVEKNLSNADSSSVAVNITYRFKTYM
jgi:hypothetical protein